MIYKVESDDLQGQGIEKIIIPSNIIDIWTRLDVLLRLKLTCNTHSLTKASHLMDELYKRGEIENEQENQMLLINSILSKWRFQVNF